MAFSVAVVLLVMSSKCIPFNISVIFGNKIKSLGLDPVNRQGVPTYYFIVAKKCLISAYYMVRTPVRTKSAKCFRYTDHI
jgi:hypothetical protein